MSAFEMGRARTRLMAELPPGQMMFWAREWWRNPNLGPGQLGREPTIIEVRPRVAHHGGKTRTAVRD